MTKKELVIVIPYIDLPHYILGLLKTIKTKYSHHIYLIDNGSDPQTKETLAHLSQRENITIIFNDTNIGVSGAWNQGINLAINEHCADYVVILNNDTLLHPACIDNMIAALDGKNIPLVSAINVCEECAVPEDILKLKIPPRGWLVDAPDFSCYALDILALESMARLERNIEEYPGFFDAKFYPAYFEDNDYHYRLKLCGRRGVKNNQAPYYHYGSRTIHENEKVSAVINTSYLQNKERFFQKWGGEPGKEKFKTPFQRD